MRNDKPTLWSFDFTTITLGTVISAIGGTAMRFALGLVVFDNTASSWMTGFFNAISLLPTVVIPILFAPYADSHRRKPVIWGLDALLGIFYLLFGVYIARAPFSYGAYMAFSVFTGSVGSMYSTAYQAFYPDTIPEGFMQKGYAVSSMIYPSVTVLITPIAAMVYSRWGIELIFIAEGVLLLIAALLESRMRIVETHMQAKAERGHGLAAYREQVLGGFEYLRREKGVRSIYINMGVINATSNATSLMTMTHFQSSPGLSTAMYSLLISAETLGRMLGGVVHYVAKIPERVRFRLTAWVYRTYSLIDGALLCLPYFAMIALKFVCGFLGVNTATLRETAIQSYLPSNVRARVNSLFSVVVSLAMMLTQLGAGALGEVLPYRWVSAIFALVALLSIQFVFMRNRKSVEPIFDKELRD